MSEHTVPCRGCGSLIEKESGCDLIECLCGFRFCYSCGKQGGVCGCNPNHHFLNERNYIDDAPVRVGQSGIVNIRACILRRQVRRERTELKTRHRNETIHAWKYSEEYANVCTCNGRWLFSPRNKKYEHDCISMLRQQLCHEQAVEKRGEEYKSRMWEEQCRGQTNDANMNNWLFLRKGSDVRAMKQLLYAYEEQRIRQRKQRRLVQEMEALGNESCVSWLFLPNKTGCKILLDMYDAARRHYKRMRSRAIKKRSMIMS